MPVKIRCSSCSTVLKIPDRARGKKIKCPKCDAKLLVPTGPKAESAAAVGKKRKKPDSSAFLLSLNPSHVEDRSARICPKCGVDVTAEDLECPACGVDLQTGLLSLRARKRKERKGPPPEEFYAKARAESWRFLKKNKKLPLRLAASWIVFSLLSAGCWVIVIRCATWPPEYFWTFVGFVLAMVPLGFTWFLHTEVIRATLSRKDKFKRLHAEIFKNVALGIKFFVWIVMFTLPFHLVTGTAAVLFWHFGIPAGALFLGILGFVPAIILFPIAMAHMSMPVTYPGWLALNLLKTFGKMAAPTLYWCLLCWLTMLPTLGGLGVLGGVFRQDFLDFKAGLEKRAEIAAAKAYQPPSSKDPIPPEITEIAEQTPPPLAWQRLIAPTAIWVVCCITFAFAAVYNMRTNGHLAVYFRPELALISQEKEIKYVPKAQLEKEEEPSTVATVLALAILTLVGCVVLGILNEELLFYTLVGLFSFLNWIPVAGLWRIFEKAHEPGWSTLVPVQREITMARIADKPPWWGILLLIPGVNVPMWFMVNIEIARQFGQSAGFGIGMALMSPVFYCILGFGKYKYRPEGA